MDDQKRDVITLKLVAELEKNLLSKYGPLLSGPALWEALGYRSIHAFRKAQLRGTIPVPLFTIPSRRGQFALAKEVAQWLATVRCQHYPLPDLLTNERHEKEVTHGIT